MFPLLLPGMITTAVLMNTRTGGWSWALQLSVPSWLLIFPLAYMRNSPRRNHIVWRVVITRLVQLDISSHLEMCLKSKTKASSLSFRAWTLFVLLSGFVDLGSHAAWNAVIATEDIIHILLFPKLGESDYWSLYPAVAEKSYRSCRYSWMTENKSNDQWHSVIGLTTAAYVSSDTSGCWQA